MAASVDRPPEGASDHDPARVEAELSEWVTQGLLSADQAHAILAHERAATAGPAVTPADRSTTRPRRIPAVAEALGYLGGMLAIVGLVVLLVQYWPDMATSGRLALSAIGALALLTGGALVREQADPALARLRWFLWLASTAAAALFAAVLATDGLDASSDAVVGITAGTVALYSGLLWQWRDRPIQQFTCLGGVAVLTEAVMLEVATEGVAGLAVWLVGAIFVAAGLRRRIPQPLLAEAVGGAAVILGALNVLSTWPGTGALFAVATGFGLLALATVPSLAVPRPDQRVVGALGALLLLLTVPPTLGYFGENGGMVTGLTTWMVGAGLLLIGMRRLVRLPQVATVFGGIALLGGAALTGIQWTGFAPLFGIATATGLVALGMLPGRVLVSVLGAVGLLVNVPWAISWFFPGEGRAPLLIMVTGALIIGLAVLLTRRGGLKTDQRQPPQDKESTATDPTQAVTNATATR